MRILLLSQHFAPEVTAARFRMQAFTEALVARGHEVDVLTAVPNHPRGVVEEGYRGRLVVSGSEHGARVRHLWVFARPEKTLGTRIGFYASYLVIASAAGIFHRRPDVILASSPPLPVGAAGWLLAGRHRVPWVLDVRDVWPESAVALGELTNPRVIGAAERLERRLYQSAAAIVTVNEAFADQVGRTAPPSRRVEVIPNGTTRRWLEAGESESDRGMLGLPRDRFIWAYAGNLGLAQGLSVAVEAAKRLGDEYLLLIIGDGSRRAEIERLVGEATGLAEFRPLMSMPEAALHLRAADALLVSERQERTVASKLYDCCAVGRPVVAACRGELRRVVEAHQVGVTVEHGDAAELAGAVKRLRDEPGLSGRLVSNGRDFARAHLREAQAGRLAELLEGLGRGSHTSG